MRPTAVDVGTLLSELLRSQMHVVAVYLIIWTIGGLLIGILLTVLCHKLLGRFGALKMEWKRAKWLRVLNFLWMLGALGFLTGMLGGCQGVIYGVEQVVTESQFHDGVLQPAGDAGAEGLMIIDLMLQNADPRTGHFSKLTDRQQEQLKAFLEGRREMNITEFMARLRSMEDALVSGVSEEVREEIFGETGTEPDGILGVLLELLLQSVVRQAVHSKAEGQLEKIRLEALAQCIATLPEAAAAAGNPDTATHAELATHIIDKGAVPTIIEPTKGFVRAHQTTYALMIPGVPAISALFFWLLRLLERWLKRRRGEKGV